MGSGSSKKAKLEPVPQESKSSKEQASSKQDISREQQRTTNVRSDNGNEEQAEKSAEIIQPPVTGPGNEVQDIKEVESDTMVKPNKDDTGKVPWVERLKAVSAGVDSMWSSPREERSPWKEKLNEAEKLLKHPRKPLPKDAVNRVIRGDLNSLSAIPTMKKKVLVFVSSTFTDTTAERNTLMKDVYPYLRTLCRALGLEFGTVDMRWGVREETTMEHGTAEMCQIEIQRCITQSAGPSFLGILGHKYGYRPLPAEILKTEFEAILSSLQEKGEDATILSECYNLDTNHIPPAYVLISRNKFSGDWWAALDAMKDLIDKAMDALEEGEKDKYIISITENEMTLGILDNDERDVQSLLLKRELQNITSDTHKHRHVIDMKDKTVIDQEAIELSNILKSEKLPSKLSQPNIIDSDYPDKSESEARKNVTDVCDIICEKFADKILKTYGDNLHMEVDSLFQEVAQHWNAVQKKCEMFLGREDLLDKIMAYQLSDSAQKLFAVHGISGCGKTALMCKAAFETSKKYPQSVVVVRLLGTTGDSGAARSTLTSLCQQICRAYDKDASQIPSGYKELIAYFRQCLLYASHDKPLRIFLDSLDQLSNEDFGKNLKWLSLRDELPDYVHLVVSTLPGECLDIIDGFIPVDNLLQVKTLNLEDGPLILEKMLNDKGRTLTDKQRDIILIKFEKCPLPLYLRLAADIGARWHSYDDIHPDDVESDMKGLVTTIFNRLQSKYGAKLIHHAFAYITAAKNGLSEVELEDILSCDDEVLDEVFEYFAPPIRRIPPLLWLRVRNDLGIYLMERGADGTSCYGWYHRQFWETAEKLYLDKSPNDSNSFRPQALQAILEYFEGKHVGGKMFTPKAPSKRAGNALQSSTEPKMADRQIPRQPTVLSGTRDHGLQLNMRKLSELPYVLLRLKRWEKFEQLVANLEFIEAKFQAGQGYTCLAEFIEAVKTTSNETVKAMSKLIGFGISHLLRHPHAIYQLASQQVKNNPAFIQLQQLPKDKVPIQLVKDTNPEECEDPCEMTLLGHTDGLHYCEWSRDGSLIVSAGRDASVRVWDVFNGAEMLTLSDLPGANYPSDTWATWRERVCCFGPDDKTFVTGAEDGTLQYWDLKGSLLQENKDHSEAITAVAISPDDSQLASASKDGTVRFWSTSDWQYQGKGSISGWAFGVSYSPNGDRVATGIYQGDGMAIIDAKNYRTLSSSQGHCNMNLCCAWSPRGSPIVTGGDHSSVSIWDPSTNQAVGILRGHQGWIWCTKFTPDGAKLVACSSDRTAGIWCMNTQSLLYKLGGHVHRVAWAALNRDASRMVTGSLDCALKVWDFHAVAAGQMPKVKGLHYSLLKVSPNQQIQASLTGWSRCATFENAGCDNSATHKGAVQDCAFSPDSQWFITFDMGHTGNYPAGAEKNAETYATNVSTGGIVSLNVSSPAAVGATDKHVIVGTYSSKVHLFPFGDATSTMSWDGGDGGKIINSVAWSKSYNHAAVSVGNVVKVWDISDVPSRANLVTTLKDHNGQVTICEYSHDGKLFACGSNLGTLYITTAAADKGYSTLVVLTHHTGLFRDLQFSPDGRYLGSATVEMCIRVWDIDSGFRCKGAFYGPVNKFGFISDKEIVTGEATGNKRVLKFAK